MPINRARAKRIIRSGHQILDSKGNVWNVLVVDSSVKSQRCWFQLMQLRDAKGHRKYDKLIEGAPGRTLRTARNKLIKKFYTDQIKLVKYDAINNVILKIIE